MGTMKLGFLLMSCILVCACSKTSVQTDSSFFSGLGLQLEANSLQARVGEPVHVSFKVENTREHVKVIESQATPVIDIVVQGEDRQVLLTWSSQNPDKVSHRIEWKPGETKIIELTWVPKQEDLRFGYYYNIYLGGILNQDSKIVQSTTIGVCASNFCR